MGRIRLTSLLLGLLLSLVALGGSIANAHQVLGPVANSHEATTEDHKGLLPYESRPVATTRSKGLRGRKMGAEEAEKKETVEVKGTLNTGKARNSRKKSLGSPDTKINDKTQDPRTNILKPRPPTTVNMSSKGKSHEPGLHSQAYVASSTHGSFDPSHDRSQTFEKHKQLDEVTKMFNMLNKDYQSRASRRPPINNDIPLRDVDEP